MPAKSLAGGETRTLSLYHVHTKESLTVTYMVNGRYVPSAMKQINYLLRDWRRQEVITIDPKTIDLMYQLHEDLGSKAPVHIVCGYRSPRTNAFLKKIGRNVATKSQHMVGKAIDIFFPDVPTKKIRNNALVMQVGGVGYYSSAGGPTGFVHIDSGHVRHWGPAISKTEMAQIFQQGRRIASRSKTNTNTNGSGGGGLFAFFKPKAPPVDINVAYDGNDEDMSSLSEEASQGPELQEPVAKAKSKPAAAVEVVAEAVPAQPVPAVKVDQPPKVVPEAKPVVEGKPELVAEVKPLPKPRPKPVEVLVAAAASMKIVPASAAPEPQQYVRQRKRPVVESVGIVPPAQLALDQDTSPVQVSNEAEKGSFADSLRDGTATDAPLIKPMIASASAGDVNWWPKSLIFNPDQTIRRNGAPQPFTKANSTVMPSVSTAISNQVAVVRKTTITELPVSEVQTSGKGDLQIVDRSTKGNLSE